jgi:hypothetical protein
MRRRLIDTLLLLAVAPGLATLVVAGVIVDAVLTRLPKPPPSPVPVVLLNDLDADMEQRIRDGEALSLAWRRVAA